MFIAATFKNGTHIEVPASCIVCCNECGILDMLSKTVWNRIAVIYKYNHGNFDDYSNRIVRCPRVITGNDLGRVLRQDDNNASKGIYHYIFYLATPEGLEKKFNYVTASSLSTVKRWTLPDDTSNVAPQEWYVTMHQMCGINNILVNYTLTFMDVNSNKTVNAGYIARYFNSSSMKMYIQVSSYKGYVLHQRKLWKIPLGTEKWLTETNITLELVFYDNTVPIYVLTLTANNNNTLTDIITIPNETTSIKFIVNITSSGPGINDNLCSMHVNTLPPYEVTLKEFLVWYQGMLGKCGMDTLPRYNAAYQIDVFPSG